MIKDYRPNNRSLKNTRKYFRNFFQHYQLVHHHYNYKDKNICNKEKLFQFQMLQVWQSIGVKEPSCLDKLINPNKFPACKGEHYLKCLFFLAFFNQSCSLELNLIRMMKYHYLIYSNFDPLKKISPYVLKEQYFSLL